MYQYVYIYTYTHMLHIYIYTTYIYIYILHMYINYILYIYIYITYIYYIYYTSGYTQPLSIPTVENMGYCSPRWVMYAFVGLIYLDPQTTNLKMGDCNPNIWLVNSLVAR